MFVDLLPYCEAKSFFVEDQLERLRSAEDHQSVLSILSLDVALASQEI